MRDGVASLVCSIPAAEAIVRRLDLYYNPEQVAPHCYEKTDFTVYYPAEGGTFETYSGRLDLGTEYGGLVQHIRRHADTLRNGNGYHTPDDNDRAEAARIDAIADQLEACLAPASTPAEHPAGDAGESVDAPAGIISVTFAPELLHVSPAEHRASIRRKKAFASSLAMQNCNERNSRRHLHWTVAENFTERKNHTQLVHLTYAPEWLPLTEEEAERIITNFIDKLNRRQAKKYATALKADPSNPGGVLPKVKYIVVTEWQHEDKAACQKEVRYHHHMILECDLTTDEIKDCWSTGRGKWREPLGLVKCDRAEFNKGSLAAYCEYITKNPKRRRRWRQSQGLRRPTQPRASLAHFAERVGAFGGVGPHRRFGIHCTIMGGAQVFRPAHGLLAHVHSGPLGHAQIIYQVVRGSVLLFQVVHGACQWQIIFKNICRVHGVHAVQQVE